MHWCEPCSSCTSALQPQAAPRPHLKYMRPRPHSTAEPTAPPQAAQPADAAPARPAPEGSLAPPSACRPACHPGPLQPTATPRQRAARGTARRSAARRPHLHAPRLLLAEVDARRLAVEAQPHALQLTRQDLAVEVRLARVQHHQQQIGALAHRNHLPTAACRRGRGARGQGKGGYVGSELVERGLEGSGGRFMAAGACKHRDHLPSAACRCGYPRGQGRKRR
jgi:hypothetical protein